MRPVADADRATLARRLYYDLLGLPPSPEQVDAFVHDPSPDAYERLVEQLLASPHFGERWGRHWLDVARFAESLTLRGFVLKDAWRYRDYVIEAFNQDMPFDRFVQEQVAGDLLPASTRPDRRRQLIATTFLTLGNTNLEEQDKKQLRMDVVDEQIEAIGRGFLAQTIGCARCHDHKFDPIPTRDYYALAGILRSTRTLEHANVSRWLERPLPAEPEQEAEFQKYDAAVAALQARMTALPGGQTSPEENLPEQAVAPTGSPRKKTRGRAEEAAAASTEAGNGHDGAGRAGNRRHPGPHSRQRPQPRREGAARLPAGGDLWGSPRYPGQRERPATAGRVADQPGQSADGARPRQSRLALAVRRRHGPHHGNFGTTGEAPSHPELLDYLAVRFVEDGWSMKQLVRQIVLSRTYRLSTARPAGRTGRSTRRTACCWRMNRRRLDAECIRDTMLCVSGRLQLEHGRPDLPAGPEGGLRLPAHRHCAAASTCRCSATPCRSCSRSSISPTRAWSPAGATSARWHRRRCF